MTRIAAAAALALVLAGLAGTARADTFEVVPPSQEAGARASFALPSAETPNLPGSLVLPPGWTQRASRDVQLPVTSLAALWRAAGAAYGIPWQVLAAINKIETNFGRNMGPSSAGAVGWMQFMPSTWLRWGMDGDGDGVADPWNPYDAMYAAARYLAAAGGRTDLPRAIFAYNHAHWYVRDVLSLAGIYGGSGTTEVAFALDRLQVAVDQARRQVAEVNEKLAVAVQAERKLARRESALLARAAAAPLVSDSLDLHKQAGQVGVRRDAAARRVRALRGELRAAQKALKAAREGTQGAVFTAGAHALFSTPSHAGEYVFPVGGGPAIVSVGPTHHDYPAADIAAPTGAPVYAHAAAIVRAASPLPNGRCGIGFTIDTFDGQSWTYCHLSYLEPGVRPGAVLGAGQPVGLVGSTGRSTGPHLHLQLTPASDYPQEQEWFRSFAGSAFRWQDDAPVLETRLLAVVAPVAVFDVLEADSGPIFAVVASEEQDGEPVPFTRLGG